MIKTDVKLTKLTPSKNMRLTNGTDIAEGSVFLGVGDSVEEAQKIQAERDETDALLSIDS